VRTEAYNYRTWQLVEPLPADGHDVSVAAVSRFRPVGSDRPERLQDQALDAWLVEHRRPNWRREIQRLHDRFKPEAVVATGQLMCLAAAGLRTTVPCWFDLYGDSLFEWQAAMGAMGSHRGLRSAIGFQTAVLRRGDVFSTLGTPQTEALIGRLALLGRLHHLTLGYEFVHTIVPGMPGPVGAAEGKPTLRGAVVPAGAFMVLWVGGYNAWCDTDTLFQGLELAMARQPHLHFASVGGPAVTEAPYRRLESLIAESPNRSRYHLLGWRQDRDGIVRAYREANVGICTDLAIYETRFGTRTRLLEMAGHGLPVVSSSGCEIAGILQREGAAFIFPSGDASALGNLLIRLASDDRELRQAALRGRALAAGALSFAATTQPLRTWASAPKPAPDRAWRARWTVENAVRWWWRSAAWKMLGRM
jgi:glycosyltransferase involved in cell wall biosynthesis